MRKFGKIPVLLLFLVITVLFFDSYFFRGKPLFPGDLLVSFYSPWKYEQFPGWEQGIPNKPIGFDNLRFFYPIKKEILTQISQRKLPLWNPYSFSGNVLFGDSQSAVLYPLNLLFLFLPFMHAWSLLVVSIPLIAGIFTYLFLRAFNLSRVASFFGGFSFAFSGFMVVWMEENPAVSHSAVWLPVALYAVKKFIDTRQIRFWLLAILALVFSVLAGFLQIAIYLWTFTFIFTLYELIRLKEKSLAVPLLAIFGFSFLISAIQFIPSFEAYLASPRITASAEYLAREYLAPLTFLTTLVAPDIFGNPGTYNFFGGGFYYDKILYVGLIPLIFAIYEVMSKKKATRFFIFLAILILILGFDNPFSRIIFWLRIPFFSTVTPSRIFYLFAFCVSILAAFGLDRWASEQNKKGLYKVIGLIVSLFFLSGLFILLRLGQTLELKSIKEVSAQVSLLLYPGILFEPRQMLISIRNLIVPLTVFLSAISLLILWLKQPRWGKWLTIFLLILSIVHQYYFFKKSLYLTDDKRFEFPETQTVEYLKEKSGLNRVIGVGEARIFPNLLLPYHLFSSDGLDPVFSRRYGEFMNVVNGRQYSIDIPRIEARFFLEKEEDLSNKNKLKALSFLGIKYLLVPPKTEEKPLKDYILPQKQFQKVYDDQKITIWENKEAFPRCWLVNDFIVEDKQEEIIKKMFSENFNLKTQVILEENPSVKLSNFKLSDSKVEIIEYNADSLKIKASATTDSIIFCTDNFFPGWRAKIDEGESKIYRADYTFRAVVIPIGTHEIVFSYEPLTFRYGSLISAVGLLGAGIYAVFLRRLR